MKRASYAESERICEATFANGCPWWHLYTPGMVTSLIFADADDFRYAINLLARCHNDIGTVVIIAFEIMSNHIHLVLSGKEDDIRRFFVLFKRRLKGYMTSKGRMEAIGQFTISLRSCFDLFEMFFEVKKTSFSSRFFSQIAPLSSLEEAVEPEVFHSQIFKQTNQNSF